MNRGAALVDLGRSEEAVAALNGAARQQAVFQYVVELLKRRTKEDLVNEGMKHLERDLACAKDLETRLAQLADKDDHAS